MVWPASLVLAGAGKMGGAMLRGWLDKGLPAAAVHVVDPHLDADAVAAWRGRGVAISAPAQPPEVLVLAVKPQSFAADPSVFAPLAGTSTLVLSILAGKTLASLRAGLPQAGAIVRTMPNLPASIGCGATGAAAEPGLSDNRRAMAQTLLATLGLVEWLDETLIDAVTAVSGSGPAYVFYLTECVAEAGIAAGLPPDVSARLARAMVEGAAALLAAEADKSPATLRQSVTSPGGTTAAALDVLRQPDGLARLMTDAIVAAARRAGELAG
jgi:pyrroline-5-carboxylate reductase